ncbi:hypothetical protein DXD16_05680 [Collinsella sp. TF11-5AC]|nr:hypothetical protein DXD16_05680 [Collinsella sp. TF11-5AC]
MEGFFGLLKKEFWHGRDWSDWTPPASSRSSGAGSADTIRRGAAMRSVAARRPSSAPRWEGPRNGPRNRPQFPFLPLWDSFLLGLARPKPC